MRDLRMGVRIDVPGIRWWDYHTVGANMKMRIAQGPNKIKPGAMLTRREYLCDASFLVALQGDSGLIHELAESVATPKWTLYLGRKCCPPSRPLLLSEKADEAPPLGLFDDLLSALKSVPWRRRFREDKPPKNVDCLLDWQTTTSEPEAPADAVVWYDVPVSFDPPAHEPRLVVKQGCEVGSSDGVSIAERPAQNPTPRPVRSRANYGNTEYRKVRAERLAADHHCCVFCKAPLEGRGATVQHITYRRAGGNERPEDLRSLCRLCHDAVTMIEYGLGMGLDRINPQDLRWRDKIIAKRKEIIEFRSLETRRRRLEAEEVE